LLFAFPKTVLPVFTSIQAKKRNFLWLSLEIFLTFSRAFSVLSTLHPVQMRRIFAPFFLVFLLAFVACETSTTTTGPDNPPTDSMPEPPPVPIRFASPEGIASDGQFVYISNVGPELMPQARDGDGYVLKLSADLKSSFDSEKFSAIKLNAPKGMAVLNKVLYIADIDRLVVIDLKKMIQMATFDFSRHNVDFLNDVAVKDDSTLFVSATNSNQIFQVNLKENNFALLETEPLLGPNGLFYQSEENKLYCAEWGTGDPNGRLIAIDPPTGKIKVLHQHTGNLDGIAFLRSGNLVFSDWASNSILELDMIGGELTTFYINPDMAGTDSINGPADIWFDTASDQLYVPFMIDSKVSIFPGSKP
jgi:hypothetical protein